jgi:hypothetical protein
VGCVLNYNQKVCVLLNYNQKMRGAF